MTPPKPSSLLAVAAGNGNSSVPDRDQLIPIVSDWVSLQQRSRLKNTNLCHASAPCIYENRRAKPGLKGGAVESLNQRLEKVEKALFGSEHDQGTQESETTKRDLSGSGASNISSTPLEAVLSTLAGELQKLNQNIEPTRKRKYEYDPYRKVSELFKRRRQDEAEEQRKSSNGDAAQRQTSQDSLCRIDIIQDHLDKLVEAHFYNVQPWIPMVIMRGFHDRLQTETEQRMTIVLEAMMIASLRYVEINVEYMGLSVEPEVYQRRRGLLSESSSLPEPRDWLEEEERRRIFWNIFILDKIASIIKGWSPGIKSEHVRRRLPICGGSWFHNEPAVTPYFGNWNEPSISKSFLQPTVEFTNRQEVSLWLTKFKELDLRLVHWKMNLPQQWKDSGVSRKIMPGVMDPSMTLANATHNTSVILLHERIAYPGCEVLGLNIPSHFSAQNCLNAAIETANITTKYLGGYPSARPVPPQMGICAFVSARTLLVHSQYYNAPLSKEYQNLMDNLTDMSNRWTGHEKADQTDKSPNFFNQLFSVLQDQYKESQEATTEQSIARPVPVFGVEGPIFNSRSGASRAFQDNHAQPSPDVPQTINSLTNEMHNPAQLRNHEWHVDSQSPHTISKDDLFTISQTLLNNDFLELDRIVSFEDMMAVGNMTQYYGTNS
ncbi:hypothetical protein FPHYL_7151 [Fusarium phyllophilum]|uniref:Xylanolytic transcriptional activator regulatory domain-containing protein n=1 Tax=Fusarium phyllophilum TaxID=47803 RepID=A0A8H5JRN0_9HYPO|nr:hypothetical protein FPHYL_7151 [Fusarium phyllophilum]